MADTIDYPSVAELYGCKYSGRGGVTTVPTATNGTDGKADGTPASAFATDRVLLVTCTRA